MTLTFTPLSGALGAQVEGVDLANLHAQAQQLRDAWATYQVLAFPQIHLNPAHQIALANVFGTPEPHGVDGGDTRDVVWVDDQKLVTHIFSHTANTNNWHTDATFRQAPPVGALLALVECPDAGGDTMWASTTRAYETLAPALQALAGGLSATHGSPMTGSNQHPVVTTHPVSGKQVLNVNRGWTRTIDGLPRLQGADLLRLLCNHIEQPEHTMRWSWQLGDAVIWDNRCTQHYAIYDYGNQPRSGHRVIIAAEPA